MVKKLAAIGNSLGVIIDRPILDLLSINKDTPLEIKTDGNALIIKPIRDKSSLIADTAAQLMQEHDETLRKLAQ